MLGIYEKRRFSNGEKIWLGRYKNLSNVLHWHFECEIIRIVSGRAKIKIGDFTYEAKKNDCFFCPSEELHYIISEAGAKVEVAIFDKNLIPKTLDEYTITDPLLSESIPVAKYFDRIKKELQEKNVFYREVIENQSKALILDIFQHCQIEKRSKNTNVNKDLIAKITRDFSFITFEDAVHYSGYSASHFSKIFKKLTGINFSEYLNVIKVENAIVLLQQQQHTMTSVSQKCGFSTIRNFNRVFKKITGYSPLSLPKNFTIDTGLSISNAELFDPTEKKSILIQ